MSKHPRVFSSRPFVDRPTIYPAVVGPDGRRHAFLNSALPRDPKTNALLAPLTSGICEVCGHAYADLMRKNASSHVKYTICDECRSDAWMAHVAKIQAKFGERMTPRSFVQRDVETERARRQAAPARIIKTAFLAEVSSSPMPARARRPHAGLRESR